MRFLIDFFPIALFVAAYKLHDMFGISKDEAIYFATPVLMAATVGQMAILYWIDKKLTTLQKITLGMILVFGGITLVLHDKRFIMWKPTVVNWLFAAAFLCLPLLAALMVNDGMIDPRRFTDLATTSSYRFGAAAAQLMPARVAAMS